MRSLTKDEFIDCAKYFGIPKGTYWVISGFRDHDYINYDPAQTSWSTGSAYSSDVHQLILCSDSFRPKNFVYSLRAILDIFLKNNLQPNFNNKRTVALYHGLAVDKPEFLKNLAKINEQIADKAQIHSKEYFLSNYDLKAIAASPIQYCAADENLTPEEKIMLEKRQKLLAQQLELDLNLDDVEAQISEIKSEAVELAGRIDKINHGKNVLSELGALEAESRVSFEFLVENVTQIVSTAQKKVSSFAPHKDFIKLILDVWMSWNDAYKNFRTTQREQFNSICEQNAIDVEDYSGWYKDWKGVRFAIEQRFQPLVEFAFGKVEAADAAINALKVLQEYREAVDNFYLNERKNIHQKFAFTAGGDLQEKFETESELYKLAEKFQRDLSGIIFASEAAARVFLLKWAEPLTHVAIDELTAFIQDKNLDAISAEVLGQFAELKRQNFAAYLSDAQAYGAALQKREQEFNALVFRMRKDLNRQG